MGLAGREKVDILSRFDTIHECADRQTYTGRQQLPHLSASRGKVFKLARRPQTAEGETTAAVWCSLVGMTGAGGRGRRVGAARCGATFCRAVITRRAARRPLLSVRGPLTTLRYGKPIIALLLAATLVLLVA